MYVQVESRYAMQVTAPLPLRPVQFAKFRLKTELGLADFCQLVPNDIKLA